MKHINAVFKLSDKIARGILTLLFLKLTIAPQHRLDLMFKQLGLPAHLPEIIFGQIGGAAGELGIG